MKILLTGCAGFIGSHVAEFLLIRGDWVVGLDIVNEFYDTKQKEYNLEILKKYPNFRFLKMDINQSFFHLLQGNPKLKLDTIDCVCHLAAYAGVLQSIEDPLAYVDSNIRGTVHLLKQCINGGVDGEHIPFVYASSSSVYGKNTKVPFCEEDSIDMANSPYAVSKICDEIFSKMYNQLYGNPVIALRFFTVYGPRGRPDMAPYKFLKMIHNDEPLTRYGNGSSSRDYTYIDDIVFGVVASMDKLMDLMRNGKGNFHQIYNLGNNYPVGLNKFIEICEKVVGKKANILELPNQTGDVPQTWANIDKIQRDLGYQPTVELEEGLHRTYQWLVSYLN